MNKENEIKKEKLISNIAEKADVTKVVASALLNATLDCISDALTEGNDVKITGFGSFGVITTKARQGRNPRTGEAIDIPESQRVSFKSGKLLRKENKCCVCALDMQRRKEEPSS